MKVDWCTAWPDRWAHIDYSECCHQHDIDYSYVCELPFLKGVWERRKADYRLMRCIQKSGLPWMGIVMFIGVRCCGWLFAYKKEDL